VRGYGSLEDPGGFIPDGFIPDDEWEDITGESS
jgi:hypothetical protein